MKNITVLLDNGHGKETPGKRSPLWPDNTQLFEYEFNRDIVKRISAGLGTLGVNYNIIVPELIDIPLLERCQRVNDLYRKMDCILFSIHANAGGGTGWECHTSSGNTLADTYSKILYDEATMEFSPEWMIRKGSVNSSDPDWDSPFTLLMRTNCPAILSENFFFDNPKDCKLLLSEDGRKRIADVHVRAIVKILR